MTLIFFIRCRPIWYFVHFFFIFFFFFQHYVLIRIIFWRRMVAGVGR